MTLIETARPSGLRREIVTPEGIALRVTLAGRGARLAAVLIDLFLIVFTLVVIVLVFTAIGSDIGANWALSLGIVLSFGIRSFYFIFFELHWQGTTPGKRLLDIRVIDRAGGQLRPNAVFARNLMREIELFIPISLMLTSDGGLANLLTLFWTGALLALPFFNRDRLRSGDIVAGTWVIETPKTALLPDIAETPPVAENAPAVHFTEAHLAVYGEYELQTLEKVLRQEGPDAKTTWETVAARIRNKTGWQPEADQPVDAHLFLQTYYAALRARLERKVLFGKRRANKFDPD